ncbi:MAG TPA: hypothetical protein VMK42_07375 [Anaeromyxobacteraceae bacterium]|nr:hypothetical protein [Anaeromyxobacteraceae bacterium]
MRRYLAAMALTLSVAVPCSPRAADWKKPASTWRREGTAPAQTKQQLSKISAGHSAIMSKALSGRTGRPPAK